MKTGDLRLTRILKSRARAATLAALALGAQAGCGREFYRNWANQDVSEAIFEKSRDPRWRMDLFSVEPPALSRYSNPYDPDRPPAPPDDHASEATSPVPQWPENRLLIPAEGTGYLDMMEAWKRDRKVAKPNAGGAYSPTPPTTGTPSPFSAPSTPAPAQPGGTGPPAAIPAEQPPPTAIPGAASAPAQPGGASPPAAIPAEQPAPVTNPGTTPALLTPILSPAPAANPPTSTAPPATTTPSAPSPPQAKRQKQDLGVILSAFHETGLDYPVPPTIGPVASAAQPPPPVRDLRTPQVGQDPQPGDTDLTKPVDPKRLRPDLTPDQQREAAARSSAALSAVLIPAAIEFDEVEAAGLPKNSDPFVIDIGQAFTLALVNNRTYQTNLEQIYLVALPVTLQRFAFTPQFYAGLSPTTPVPQGLTNVTSGFAATTNNTFNYATKETGAQVSQLQIGAVAGYGQAFSTGARILAGFANQLVFNFIGHNSIQPKVQSLLPINIVQPFLRGGGRAVTLEPLTLAERNLLYQIRNFALFRQQFTVQMLVGGTIQNFGSAVPSLGFTGIQSTDPNIGFVNVLEDVQILENYRRNIAAFEQLKKVYTELIKGEASGLSQLQLDQIDSSLQNARIQYVGARLTYRNDLDSYKQQLGLPPDTPLIPDRGMTRKFKEAYAKIDEWQRNPIRDLSELPAFLENLPKLEDVVLDGRSLQDVYKRFVDPKDGVNDEDALEDLILAAERLAIEHRLDLMNIRAQLYDSWRAIKVSANALQGVFNIALTNQLVTPPTTTNPFGFVDQAKQFQLVLNAELPLVRVNERNNFRGALIAYERSRRGLQNQEDAIKLLIRGDIRALQVNYLTYEIAKRNLVLTIRQKDQAFEQIVAPPAGAANLAANQAPLQTTNLISFQAGLIGLENTLVTQWYNYEQNRLELYRDLGTLPIDEWEAFHAIFPDEPLSPSAAAAVVGARAARAAAVNDNPPKEGSARQ